MYQYNQYINYCQELQNNFKYRSLPDIALKKNDNFIDFSSNDYLNLSHNSQILEASNIAAIKFGIGSTGSRLLSGNNELFVQFEELIAKDISSQSSLIWNSGFIANFSALSSLLDQKILSNVPLVFFDRNNHASLYDAVVHSHAELVRYRHNDITQLASLLEKHKNDKRSKFIVIETLYGMDGDLAPLAEIIELSYKYQAFLYMDEAHAVGILGQDGYGLSTDYDLSQILHVSMGTFSKAIGSCGAYTASNIDIKNYLINKARGFIYSTSLSPAIIGGAMKAWQIIKTLNQERKTLLSQAAQLRKQINSLGFDTINSTTHIIPILFGAEKEVLNAQKLLLEYKIIASAIRPPTVGPNSSRLRIALTLKHTQEDINLLLTALKKI